MSDPTRRAQKWDAKFNTARVKETLDAMREQMKQRYEAAMAQMWVYEEKTREILNLSGIHTSNYVSYLNYSRQLYKLSRQRHVSGESFAMAAKVLKDKWAARELRPEVLDTIRTQVFDIKEPE